MGSFSIWHLIILLTLLTLLTLLSIAGGIGFALCWNLRVRRKPAPSYGSAAAATHPAPPCVENRLQQLASLRAGNLISDAEYEQQRSALLRSLWQTCLPLHPHHRMAACTCAGCERACSLLTTRAYRRDADLSCQQG